MPRHRTQEPWGAVVRLCAATAALLVIGVGAIAHHSPVKFDLTRDLTLEGVVTRVEWVNPHVYLYVKVLQESGESVAWTIEAQSPIVMARFGWLPTSLAVGERVTVDAHPSRRPGRPVALGRGVRKPDGTTLRIPWDPDVLREAIREESRDRRR